MEKYALSVMLKISIYSLLMLVVAKTVPYDELVNSFVIRYVNYDSASFIGELILGELDPEPDESVIFYVDVILNTLICVPVFSLITTLYKVIERKINSAEVLKEFGWAILRRFLKLLSFTILFFTLFRILPYQSLLPAGESYSTITTATIVMINLILTILFYWFISKRMKIKRSL